MKGSPEESRKIKRMAGKLDTTVRQVVLQSVREGQRLRATKLALPQSLSD